MLPLPSACNLEPCAGLPGGHRPLLGPIGTGKVLLRAGLGCLVSAQSSDSPPSPENRGAGRDAGVRAGGWGHVTKARPPLPGSSPTPSRGAGAVDQLGSPCQGGWDGSGQKETQ